MSPIAPSLRSCKIFVSNFTLQYVSIPLNSPVARLHLCLDNDSFAPSVSSLTNNEVSNFNDYAAMMAAVADDILDLTSSTRASTDPTYEERDEWGPKTAGSPDPEDATLKDLLKDVHVNPDLTPAQREGLMKIVAKHAKAFALDGRLGNVTETEFKIDLEPNVKPIRVPPYQTNPKNREVINKQVKKWLIQDVIEPSKSPWSSSVVVVYRNEKPRVCVDYRRLNAVTVSDNFMLAKRDDIFHALAGKQWFSTLDCLSGFQQINVAKESQAMTAFQTHEGQYQFKRLPFGLKNGPAEFQRLMQLVLADLLWICGLVYIDDIVVFSLTFENHLRDLDRVLERLEHFDVTLSPAKCFLGYRSLALLGQNVSRLGISTIEAKVKAVLDCPRPTNTTSLKSFLGMMVFYQNFIPFYSWIVSPLFKLLKKDAIWDWGEREELAWVSSKQALCEAPVLAHPIEGKPYRLYTDASNIGGSAILQQIQPVKIRDLKGTKAYDLLRKSFELGEVPKPLFKRLIDDEDLPTPTLLTEPFEENEVYVERVISMYARTWNEAEKKLSTTEKEALALKDGCIRHHPIIEGEDILAITDHEALKWAVFGFDTKNRKLQSWNSVFSAFKLKVTHRPGKSNGNADYLSRFFPEEDPVLRTDLPSSVNPSMDNVGHIDLAEKEKRAAADSLTPSLQVLLAQHRDLAVTGKLRSIHREDLYLGMASEELLESDVAQTRRTSPRGAPQKADPKTEALPPLLPAEPEPSRVLRSSAPKPSDPEPRPDESEGESSDSDAEEWSRQAAPPSVKRTRLDPDVDHVAPSSTSPTMVHVNVKLKNEILKAYRTDPYCREILEDLDTAGSNRIPPFYRDREGLLYIDQRDVFRLIIPKDKRQEVLELVHSSPYYAAHAGYPRTMSLLARMFYWKKMPADCRDFVRSCDFCQKTKVDTRGLAGKLQYIDVPDRPGDALAMDYIVGLPPSVWYGKTYNSVLVVIDRLTRFAFYIPTTDTVTAIETAKLLVDHVFTRLGFPLSIIADRDPKFTSAAFQEVAKALGIKLNLSTSHHPQTDGMTEALNKSLETGLRAFVAQDQKDWAQYLPALSFAHNSATHGSTTMTPFELLMAYHPRGPEGDLRQGAPDIYRSAEAEDFNDQFLARREYARSAMMIARAYQEKYYNRRRRPETFVSGDKVLINAKTSRLKKPKAKLNEKWLGPFEILEVLSPVAYRLRLGKEYALVHNVFSVAHLKRYFDPKRGWTPRQKMPPSRPESKEEYETEAILEHEYRRKARGPNYTPWYLVKYVGYPVAEWTEAEGLANSPRLLREYRRSSKHREVEEREARRKIDIRALEKTRAERALERKRGRDKTSNAADMARADREAEELDVPPSPQVTSLADREDGEGFSPTTSLSACTLVSYSAMTSMETSMEIDPSHAPTAAPSGTNASSHAPSSSTSLTVSLTLPGLVNVGKPAVSLVSCPSHAESEAEYPLTFYEGGVDREELDEQCEEAYYRGLPTDGPIVSPRFWAEVEQTLRPSEPSFVKLKEALLHLLAEDEASPGFVQQHALFLPLVRAMTACHAVFLGDGNQRLRPIERNDCDWDDLSLDALAQAYNGAWRLSAERMSAYREQIAERQSGPAPHSISDGAYARPSKDLVEAFAKLGSQLEQFITYMCDSGKLAFSSSGHPPSAPYAPLLLARSTYVVDGERSRSIDLVVKEHIGGTLFLLAQVGVIQLHLSGLAPIKMKDLLIGANHFNNTFVMELLLRPDVVLSRQEFLNENNAMDLGDVVRGLGTPSTGDLFKRHLSWTSNVPRHDVAAFRKPLGGHGRTPVVASGIGESNSQRGLASSIVAQPGSKRPRGEAY